MDKDGFLKIGTLSKRTGVSPATIKYYTNEGLLPKPKKTSRNMAYYDVFCINRIRAIKELQKKLYLPLKVIKKVIQAEGDVTSVEELNALIEGKGQIFETLTFPARVPPVPRAQLIRQTNISPADLKSLEKMRLIEPKNGLYNEDDIRIAEAGAYLRSHGITESIGFKVKDLEFLKKAVEKIVVQEIKIFSKKLKDKLFDEESARLAKAGIEGINSLFSILNRKFIRKIISEMREEYRKKSGTDRDTSSGGGTTSKEKSSIGTSKEREGEIITW